MEKGKEEDLKCYSDDACLASKFEFISVVGEGSFGKVLKVRNRREGAMRALKVERFRKVKAKTILRNEIEVVRKLQGKPGVPKIFSFG
jgi:serine/threonine protein kinase